MPLCFHVLSRANARKRLLDRLCEADERDMGIRDGSPLPDAVQALEKRLAVRRRDVKRGHSRRPADPGVAVD